MRATLHAQAVLMLTARLAKPARDAARPLTPGEWGRFAQWLHAKHIRPEDLIESSPRQALADWTDRTITLDRIEKLLDRGLALGLALDKWERAGLWVMTDADGDHPAHLKDRLGTRSPAVLFGCGSRRLLGQRSVAVVGSRDASPEDLAFATGLGAAAAAQGWSIVSGGARGVDQAAMLGALEREGTAIGVLSDSLLRTSTSGTWRRFLLAKSLVLVSPFDPEVRFLVHNAMDRNKHIYCLSQAAIVVASGRGAGGTWHGAIEDLKHGWVPLWVKHDHDDRSGNAELVRRGARWLPEGEIAIDALVKAQGPPVPTPAAPGGSQGELVMDRPLADSGVAPAPAARPEAPAPTVETASMSLYDHFLARLEALTLAKPMSSKQLQKEFGELCKTQLDRWLRQAAEEGRVVKKLKPVRYEWQGQTVLFDTSKAMRRGRRRPS
jgi:predicted Rossmann fold nucleotide-binding protein DprA/Smf involved in DNA uptake